MIKISVFMNISVVVFYEYLMIKILIGQNLIKTYGYKENSKKK